jgi:uncharacterized protein
MSTAFDPFSDRLARDIRNSLSSALVDVLTGGPVRAVARTAENWLSYHPAPVYQHYIDEQCRRYAQAVREIEQLRLTDPCDQALVLWNRRLYFELHELLETIWHSAKGARRTALKGVIQAAGAYVHMARGKPEAGYGLARKARQNLSAGRSELGFIANLDQLLEWLTQPSTPPPELRGASQTKI